MQHTNLVSCRRQFLAFAGISALCAFAGASIPSAATAQDHSNVDKDGTINIPAFRLPVSSLLAADTRAVLDRNRANGEKPSSECPSTESADAAAMAAIRDCEANTFYKTKFYRDFRSNFHVQIKKEKIGGVSAEIFTPDEGVAPGNADRLLVNVHGGHFKIGSRTISQLESIPISSAGRIRVVSVDYRMSPEHAFPAASEDVAAVYRELLKSYKPQNIGIYGCSAGGLLAAESIAWFEANALPLPGAVGMFGGAASYYQEGDSGILASVREGFQLEPAKVHPYFKGVNPANALAFPAASAAVMSKFPPTLLIASTRDVALSSVVFTHSQLVKLGVSADLHVWEGMDHCFFSIPDIPESRDVYNVVTRFFDQHLGK